jgi:hypothetical protein
MNWILIFPLSHSGPGAVQVLLQNDLEVPRGPKVVPKHSCGTERDPENGSKPKQAWSASLEGEREAVICVYNNPTPICPREKEGRKEG